MEKEVLLIVGQKQVVIQNYGAGGTGFRAGYGIAVDAVKAAEPLLSEMDGSSVPSCEHMDKEAGSSAQATGMLSGKLTTLNVDLTRPQPCMKYSLSIWRLPRKVANCLVIHKAICRQNRSKHADTDILLSFQSSVFEENQHKSFELSF